MQTRCWLAHEIYCRLFPPFTARGQKSGSQPLQVQFRTPLTRPSSNSSSSSCPKRWKTGKLSPPMTISGQKQLSPCPTGERAATVEKMVLTRSSRKRRQLLRKFFRRKLLFIVSRHDSRRVPSRKCSSAIAPKHEWFESMYASHFSITCKSLLRFTFCSKQHKSGELLECQIAIIGTPRVQFGEIVCK